MDKTKEVTIKIPQELVDLYQSFIAVSEKSENQLTKDLTKFLKEIVKEIPIKKENEKS